MKKQLLKLAKNYVQKHCEHSDKKYLYCINEEHLIAEKCNDCGKIIYTEI